MIDVVRAVARGMEKEAAKQGKEPGPEYRQRPQYTETLYRRLFLKAPEQLPRYAGQQASLSGFFGS